METCSICGNSFDNVCGHCITIQKTCVLCFTEFDLEETVIQCRVCFYLGHDENFSAWLNKHGSCPACRTEYKQENFNEIILEEGIISELYLEKSSVYFKQRSIFDNFSFQSPYYDFQEYVLDDITNQLVHDDTHLLISPPGSGKTIIGLSLASHFATNTLVLTPNLAVLGSWIDRLQMFFDEKNSDMALTDIYTRSTGDLKVFTISTYQQLNSSLRDLKRRKQDPEPRKQSNIPLTFVERLINHEIGMIILDEAHRLTDQWGRDVEELIQKLGNVKVVGLTATPPQEVDEDFQEIFEDSKTEIPLPMLVREKVLAPYEDYAIQQPSLKNLQNMVDKQNYQENYEIYGKLLKRTLKEVEYVNKFLSDDLYMISPADIPYSIRWLSSNLSILTYLTLRVVIQELRNIGEDFRGLILLEQENIPSKYPHKLKGTGGAIGIFEDLLSIDEIDEIDPIFVTGSSLLVDTDLIDLFEEVGQDWIAQNNLDMEFTIRKTKKKYAIIKGRGADWNTDSYTRYVTYLFETGKTQLLVGTRFLLGEGWDSQTLNTVIDLTTFATYAFVNQVKGRALRKDPNREGKVSNLWEFPPNPDLTKLGETEFNNYEKRHNIYFGIDDNGRIRNGIARLNLHSSKSSALGSSISDYDKLLSSKLVSSINRDKTYTLWKVGQKLGDLYHVVRFNIAYPKSLKEDLVINRDVLKLIIVQSKKLIQKSLDFLLNDPKYDGVDIVLGKISNALQPVEIRIPVEFDFSIIQEVLYLLQPAKRTKYLSLRVTLNKYNHHSLVTTIRNLLNLPISTNSISLLVNAPWQNEVISENDILSSGSEDALVVTSIHDDRSDNEVYDINNPESFSQQRFSFDSSDIDLIQRHLKFKSEQSIELQYHSEYEILVVDIKIDQEYIDR